MFGKHHISPRTFLSPIFLLLSLLLLGCSINMEQQIRRVPRETREIVSLSLPYTPVKAAYSRVDNTLFIMSSDNNLIHIYRHGKHVNTIGGLGFAETNFNRLADVAVSPNGKLLALDSFQKTIKKFDNNGMWLENYPLRFTSEPVLFDVSVDGMVFIYDRTTNEISIFDENLEDVMYRFGKFLFHDPVQIHIGFSYVTVYDRGSNKTFVFDTFGKLINTFEGFWQIDRYNNRYLLSGNKVSLFPYGTVDKEVKAESDRSETDIFVSIKPWRSFHVKAGIISLLGEREVKVSEILYERY